MQRLWPFLTLVALALGLTVATPDFLTSINLSSLVRQTAVINIMALGMTLVIIAGGIDLAVGSTLALSGFAGCYAMQQGWPIGWGILAGILTGGACGWVNGALTSKLRINPFIVTLGMLGILRGLVLILSGGMPAQRLPAGFEFLGEGSIMRIPFVLWLLAGCAVVVHILLEHTRMGRYAYAIGSNPDAALYSGVPVAFHTTAVYAVCGLLTGLAGMVEASRLRSGTPTAGQGYELQAIAAVVIGGGSLRGGEGNIMGTLIGAFIMGLLANGSDLLGIKPYVQQVIIGAAIILAVLVDELRKRRAVA